MNEFFAKESQIFSAQLRYPVLDSKENEGAAGTKESNWKKKHPKHRAIATANNTLFKQNVKRLY